MKKMWKIITMVGVLFMLTGCGTAAIYNVQNNPMSVKDGVNSHKIYKAIQQAGANKGWIISKTMDGVAKGQINLRSHQAIVEIKYTNTDYSIKYISSVNLKSDGNVIHTNYNGWIQNLQREINVQLSLLAD